MTPQERRNTERHYYFEDGFEFVVRKGYNVKTSTVLALEKEHGNVTLLEYVK